MLRVGDDVIKNPDMQGQNIINSESRNLTSLDIAPGSGGRYRGEKILPKRRRHE